DGVEYVTKAVEEIKDQTDAIIVLAHWGQSSLTATSDKLAEIPGVDLVIDGHSHTVMPEGKQTTGGLVASTGEYLKNLGKVTLTIDGDKVTAKAELIPRPEVFPSKNIASTISSVEDAQKVIFEEVVGKTSVALDGERANVRTGETNMGDLICDAIADGTGADVVLTNGGGIRASIDVGDITRGEVITVLPFGNYVVTKTVTGKILKDALEFGLQKYPDQNGGFPHVAGLTYQFDPSKEVGSRLVEVLVGGEALDESKSYVLATNDFMAAGGDGYVMFKDAPIQYEFGGLDEMLVAYLQKTGEVSTAVDGRITSVK
ncbi:MAG: 5'-nucleotidase C-terminal domain-containing protein, partial [Clostridia bacterium]